MQPQRLVLVTDQQCVGDIILTQFVDQCAGDWVEVGEDDVIAHMCVEPPWGAGLVLRLHPRLVCKSNERKR